MHAHTFSFTHPGLVVGHADTNEKTNAGKLKINLGKCNHPCGRVALPLLACPCVSIRHQWLKSLFRPY